jgi:hypothetical protein
MYMILAPGEGVQPPAVEVAAALEAAGWVRWSGDGPPAFVVFHNSTNKGDYFEAGFWAGKGVPIFFLGGGSNLTKRKQIASRFGAWTLVGSDNRATVAELLEAINRRGLSPVRPAGI